MTAEDHERTLKDPDASTQTHREMDRIPTLNPSALRDHIPATGLKEYWYPAILQKKVRSKPVFAQIAGVELVLFRDEASNVAALSNVCPHRGGFLSAGRCEFEGTVTCPYHGWTFDGTGECVAVLGEGPESRIPGMKGARARHFPTMTLKGLVWVWMGDGPPADPREDIPEQFFDEEMLIQYSVTEWQCNWRAALENIYDSHVFYVHRNSLRVLLLPEKAMFGLAKMGPRRLKPTVVNGRALVYRNEDRPTTSLQFHKDMKYQETYPGLGNAKWPKHGLRQTWSTLMTYAVKLRPKPRGEMIKSLEWNNVHLPAIFQVDYLTHIFSRVTVPIDAERSRIFYFHSTRPSSRARAVLSRVYFEVFHNWYMNHNFSNQDSRVIENQYYDRPEKLSATDVFALALRRLVVENARDVIRARDQESANDAQVLD